MRKDSDIIAANQELQKAASELASKLTRAQVRQGNVIASNNLDNLDKLLNGIDMSGLDLDFMKTQVLKKFHHDLQVIEKKSRLFDVQKEITRHPIFSKKGSKKYREQLREQDILLQEIKELENNDPLNINTKELKKTLKELESINKTLNSLQGMSGLLTQFSSLFSSLANELHLPTAAADAEESTLETEFAELEGQDDSPREKFEL